MNGIKNPSHYPIVNDALIYKRFAREGRSHETREKNRLRLKAALNSMTEKAYRDFCRIQETQ